MPSGKHMIDNMEIDYDGKKVLVSVNPKIYPMAVIHSAAYILIDKAYIILDGDPEKEIIATIRPKKECDLEALGRDFNNELVNYNFYMVQSNLTKNVREAIVQRALATNAQECECDDTKEISKSWDEQKGRC